MGSYHQKRLLCYEVLECNCFTTTCLYGTWLCCSLCWIDFIRATSLMINYPKDKYLIYIIYILCIIYLISIIYILCIIYYHIIILYYITYMVNILILYICLKVSYTYSYLLTKWWLTIETCLFKSLEVKRHVSSHIYMRSKFAFGYHQLQWPWLYICRNDLSYFNMVSEPNYKC